MFYSFIQLKKENTIFNFSFGNYDYSFWHDKIIIYFERAKILIDLKAPLDSKNSSEIFVYDGKLKKTSNVKKTILFKNWSFAQQLKRVLYFVKNKKINNNKIRYLNDYSFLEKIWKNYA